MNIVRRLVGVSSVNCDACSYLIKTDGFKQCGAPLGKEQECSNGFSGYFNGTPSMVSKAALDKQEGGAHYKDMPIQVVEFNQKNKLNYCEGNVVKYICRHKKKNGIEDLRKAIHYIELLIELEYPEES